ncbi:hypothetical protein BDW59DRAFT_140802 [Aspergillus cavernicola]|uniref:Uncharacterized protein n=1 Tax=Aspergillus cavernicola TaxID=176166 RepID=A0ABR4ISN9_9EURO
MAIWPFGRRGKRHTIQLDTDTRGDVALPHDSRHSFDEGKLGRKPSRKQSKRRKNRHSQPVEDFPTNLHDSQPTHYPSSALQSEQNRPLKAYTLPTANPDPQLLSRNPSLRKPKRNESPARLKKRLSKRKAYEIHREREIRMMASMPIDIPRRDTTPLSGDPMQIDGRQAHSGLSRRSDRHRSDISLSIQESAASSLSDFSETYTFKVNGFAAWTPRPIIRYVEAPRTSYSRNQRTPDRTKSPTVEASEENLRSKKRIDELADGLDAGALRELMDRDRRRRERKQLEDHEKLVRKLQRNAERVLKTGNVVDSSPQVPEDEAKNITESQRGRSSPEDHPDPQPTTQGTEAFLSSEPQGSWLRDTSRGVQRDNCQSPESANVVGNIDDSSIREQKAGQRFSFGPSQDMAMSRSTLSTSIVPSRHGLGSPDSSQFYNMTRGSVSDLSRNVDSERRLSDHSGARVNTITSIFRRGSSRLKRRYRERFTDRSAPSLNNVSHESFFKVPTPQQQAPAPYVPPKVLLGSSSFKRSQSKFTEHFGDEPLSPPDSRLQSPDIPEDEPMVEDQVPDLHTGSYYPIPGSRTDGQDSAKSRHDSWAGDSLEDDPENLPLSQSLASIDSEGSWMSGQFLRRISQKPSSSARQSLNSSRIKTDEGLEKSSKGDENSGDAQFVAFGAFPGEAIDDSSNTTTDDQDKDIAAPLPTQAADETWHQDIIAKRPVLVNPAMRPKSTEGLLKNVRSLSPISAEEEFSPIQEHSAEILFSPTHDLVDTHAHQHHR